MNKNKYAETPRKPRLNEEQINFCLLHMLRVPELFDYAKQHLKPTDFSNASEMYYAIIWDSALTAAISNDNKLPDKLDTVMQMDLAARLARPETYNLSDRDVSLISELFGFIFAFDKEKLDVEYYRKLIQDLIIERTVIGDMGRELSTYRDIGRPVDILKSLEGYHKKLQNITANPGTSGQTAFPIDYKPKKLGKFSTGVPWFDAFMNGGQAPGEIYVLLGPTGLGKTTTGVGLTVGTARIWNAAYANGAITKRKVSCFFSWEQDKERLMHRFWSFAAQIDSSRLEDYADEKTQLSTRANLQPYELKLFQENISASGGNDGEQERLITASKELNESVRIFDFSGAADNPHIGEGGLDEVAAALRGLVQEGCDIGVVVLDYANAAVRKLLAGRGEDMSHMRLYLANFCNESRFKIALPFDCPVWVLNQLNTEANRRSSGAKQHHSYASECGNFAENAWFAFVFGTKDIASNTCQLFCTKTRRAKDDRPPAVLEVRGNLCTMVDVSTLYTAVDGRIMLTSQARAKVTPEEARKKMEELNPGSSNIINY